MSFDSASIVHLIIASSIGEMQFEPLNFAGYDRKGTYNKSEEVTCRLRENAQRGREVLEVIEQKAPECLKRLLRVADE